MGYLRGCTEVVGRVAAVTLAGSRVRERPRKAEIHEETECKWI